jgi:hypothetical protein
MRILRADSGMCRRCLKRLVPAEFWPPAEKRDRGHRKRMIGSTIVRE